MLGLFQNKKDNFLIIMKVTISDFEISGVGVERQQNFKKIDFLFVFILQTVKFLPTGK